MCSGRMNSSCSTSVTRRVTLVTYKKQTNAEGETQLFRKGKQFLLHYGLRPYKFKTIKYYLKFKAKKKDMSRNSIFYYHPQEKFEDTKGLM
jgi:hypothetical protein